MKFSIVNILYYKHSCANFFRSCYYFSCKDALTGFHYDGQEIGVLALDLCHDSGDAVWNSLGFQWLVAKDLEELVQDVAIVTVNPDFIQANESFFLKH